MIEEQQTEGIEGLGRRVWHAQTGRYFLFKWILIAAFGQAVALPIRLLFMPSRTSPGIPWQFWASIFLSAFVLSALQGFALFRWQWRMWLWIVFYLACRAVSMYSALTRTYIPFSWFINYSPWLVLVLLQMLLLIGIRRRPGLWLVCGYIAFGIPMANLLFGQPWISDLSSWLGTNASLSSWIDTRGMIYQSAGFLGVIMCGATLAWLMPPVQKRND